MRPTVDQRFWAKVGLPDENGCLPWLAGKLDGYGMFVSPGECTAHRYAYRRAFGDIPARMVIDHLCCNPSCVNAEHLEAVSSAENMARGVARRRAMALQVLARYSGARA